MNFDLVSDIWASCRQQLRRSPGGIAFLWLSLTVAISALLIGFSHAESIRLRGASRVPGELERLSYVRVNAVIQETDSSPWQGFKVPFLQRLVDDGVVSGFFFNQGPARVMLNGTEVGVYLIVYDGWVPLYGTKDAGVLSFVADSKGVAITRALALETPELGENTSVVLGGGEPLKVEAIVGHDPDLDPQWWVLIPAALAPPETGSNRIGFYDASPTLVATMKELLSDTEPPVSVQLQRLSGFEEHRSELESGQALATLAVLGAFLVGVVALVNLTSISSVWLLHRSYGFGLRRALGATIGLLALYLIAELLLIFVPAFVSGLGLTFLITRYGPIQFIFSAVSLSSIGLATLVILVGGALVALVLIRQMSRSQPVDLLRRGS